MPSFESCWRLRDVSSLAPGRAVDDGLQMGEMNGRMETL